MSTPELFLPQEPPHLSVSSDALTERYHRGHLVSFVARVEHPVSLSFTCISGVLYHSCIVSWLI